MTIPWYIGWPSLVILAWLMLAWTASRSLYYPLRYPAGDWELAARIGAEDVTLRAAGGVRLHAWWIPAPGSGPATLFLHGNAGNITHRGEHAREIVAAGSSLLLLDYRGYGRSEGSPGESGLYRDADAAYEHLLARFPAGRIIVHGESLGTAVAVDLASRKPCGGVILEAPFSSASDVAARVLPVIGRIVMRRFDSTRKVAKIRAPLLVIHGDRDEVIPFDLGRKLFDAALPPKEFRAVAGANHNDLVASAGPAYGAMLREFYRRVSGR